MRPTSSSPSNGQNKSNNQNNVIDFASAKSARNNAANSPESVMQLIDSGEMSEEEYEAYAEYYGDNYINSDDNSEPATADAPKIKFEISDADSGINAYALGTTIMVAVGLAIFFCGVAFKLSGLSIVGVIAVALSILMAVFHYRSNAEAERRKRDKTVDKEVESFKIDLYKTLVGYDIHVNQDEIDALIEQYRMDRIASETSFASFNPISMLKLAISTTKETNEQDSSKNKSKRKKKKAKEKAAQQAMANAIDGMSDEELIDAVTNKRNR